MVQIVYRFEPLQKINDVTAEMRNDKDKTFEQREWVRNNKCRQQKNNESVKSVLL
jgi:hypothetical protein